MSKRLGLGIGYQVVVQGSTPLNTTTFGLSTDGSEKTSTQQSRKSNQTKAKR